MNAKNQLGVVLEDALRDAGVDLQKTGAALREYVAERMLHLATITGEPGYAEALQAEGQAVVLFAANRAIDAADAMDARVLGIVEGLLRAGARLTVPA